MTIWGIKSAIHKQGQIASVFKLLSQNLKHFSSVVLGWADVCMRCCSSMPWKTCSLDGELCESTGESFHRVMFCPFWTLSTIAYMSGYNCQQVGGGGKLHDILQISADTEEEVWCRSRDQVHHFPQQRVSESHNTGVLGPDWSLLGHVTQARALIGCRATASSSQAASREIWNI